MKALLVALALVLVVGTAQADPADPVMHACARDTNGALRLSMKCNKYETAVTWNQQGPAGQDGQDAGFTLLSGHIDIDPADPATTKVVTCPGVVLAGSAWLVMYESETHAVPVRLAGDTAEIDWGYFAWSLDDVTDFNWNVTCAG